MNQHVRIGEQGCRGDKKYCGRQIPGHVEGFGDEFAAAICAGETMDSNGAPVFLDGSAKFFEGQLSVIPSSRRLRDAGHAIGKKSSEKNCGFYLGTGHGHFVIDGLETDSANFERRKIIVARANVCAHLPQRTDDALHGSFLQRVVTCELRCKLLPGQNSRQQPHGRPGIFGVERAPTALQAAQPAAGHANCILVGFDFGAQRAHAAQGAVTIGCRRKMPQFAGSFGQRREHRIAMGDGLVAGQVQSAGQVFCWLDGLFFHAEILTRGVTPARIPRAAPEFQLFNFHFQRSNLTIRPVFAGHALYHALKSRRFAIRIIR